MQTTLQEAPRTSSRDGLIALAASSSSTGTVGITRFSRKAPPPPPQDEEEDEFSPSPTAEQVEAEWWDKVKDDVDSERTGLFQYHVLALTAAERDEKRIIAAEAAGDTTLAALIQKEIDLQDASFAEMEKSEEIECAQRNLSVMQRRGS